MNTELPKLPAVAGVRFRHVPYRPGYAVGDDGSAWSCRNTHGGFRNEWRRLKGVRDRDGYLVVNIRGGACAVHRLVLRAFVGPCPAGQQCRHLDGNPANNRLGNLRWGTRRENQADRLRHGTYQFGEWNPNAKLTERHAELTRELAGLGMSQTDIAELWGCSPSAVGAIVRGETWTMGA